MALSDHKLRKVAISLFNFSTVLVHTLSLKPVLRPFVQIKLLVRTIFIEANLHASDKVRKLSVLPRMALEVDLESLAEHLPAHEEDELLDQTRALAIRDTVDKRFGCVRGGAFGLDLVIRWHQVICKTPSLVA